MHALRHAPNRGLFSFATIAINFTVVYSGVPVHAQLGECRLPERFRQVSPTATADDQFGAAVDISATHAIVTALGSHAFTPNGGAAYIYEVQPDSMTLMQTLGNLQPAGNIQYGVSAAIDGDVAVVGAPMYSELCPACGGVFVYRYNGSDWVQEAILTQSQVPYLERFGTAVDVKGDLIAVGAPRYPSSDNGSVYLFRHDAGTWTLEATLAPVDSPPYSHFGGRLALNEDGTMLVVGAVPAAGVATSPAYVFNHTSEGWQQQQILAAPIADSDFGRSVAIHGTTIVIGAPLAPDGGAAHVFESDVNAWNLAQSLTGPPSPLFEVAKFGQAVAIGGDRMLIAAPARGGWYPACPSSPYPALAADVGEVHSYQRLGGLWMLSHSYGAEHQFGPAYLDDIPAPSGLNLGGALALHSGRALAGAPASSAEVAIGGGAFVFELAFEDCDGNGLPDQCDPDCNFNGVNDACELAAGSAMDCNVNGLPDECDAQAMYTLDDGQAEFVYGVWANPPGQPMDLIWLNQFTVQPGGEYITHIGIYWSYYTPQDLPFTALVYDDPNNDGDAYDAALLLASHKTAHLPFPDAACVFPHKHTAHAIPRTFVGNVGDSFFVGFRASLDLNQGGVAADATDPDMKRSWRASAPFGQHDVADLMNNANPIGPHANNDYLISAMALDCNGNGVWDQCDIDSGFSLDLNANGIPDECDQPCFADINHSGGVDVSDLLAVISAWGPCPQPCPADINGSGQVDVNDLLAVINAWGDCP